VDVAVLWPGHTGTACTLPKEGYEAASYLVGYGGSGHGICIALHSLWFIYLYIVHCHGSVYEVFLNFVLKFISGFGYLFI
jgi:hypothetical protein